MKTRTELILTAAAALCCGLSSCSTSDKTEGEPTEPTELVNMISEGVPMQLTQQQRAFATDNNAFTLRFADAANQSNLGRKSFICSPLSITYVLGMVADAAEGTTRQEIEQVLGFSEGGTQAVNDYCKNLIENLPKTDPSVQLNVANAIFVNDQYTLKKQFTQDMQHYYDATAESLDFGSSQTLGHINGWCNEKSHGMIPKILDKVDPDMVSYLLNAIYFKADWTSKFDKKNTREETFTTTDGTAIRRPMMHQEVLINYQKNDLYASVTIPYGNGSWNMTVMLPEEGRTVDEVFAHLADGETEELSRLVPHEVDLKMPRFETQSDTKDGLIGLLMQMGISRVFNRYTAEVPNMCEKYGLFIEMMRQKAAIKVNEEGSEAVAVTIGGVNKVTSAGPMEYPKAVFHANRPFVYMIREMSSGVIVFVGKYTGE